MKEAFKQGIVIVAIGAIGYGVANSCAASWNRKEEAIHFTYGVDLTFVGLPTTNVSINRTNRFTLGGNHVEVVTNLHNAWTILYPSTNDAMISPYRIALHGTNFTITSDFKPTCPVFTNGTWQIRFEE